MKQLEPRKADKQLFLTPLGQQPGYGQEYPELSMLPARAPSEVPQKLLPDLAAALDAFGVTDGAVISFHHHYRNGDRLMNAVVGLARGLGLEGLTLCPSSIFPVHAPLVDALEDGTVTAILTDYMRGPVADWITRNPGRVTAMLQTHGGRARAISSGQIVIDLAFVGASLADRSGNATGRGGVAACGPLGYSAVDARNARRTVVAAHEVLARPLVRSDIPADWVDGVVQFERPGDNTQILSGSTIPSETTEAKAIARTIADIVTASGLMTPNFSLQSGAGGYSLAAVPEIGRRLAASGVTGRFVSGGITAAHVALHRAGLFETVRDVQCFDLEAVQSSIDNPAHEMMTATDYANPLNPEACVDDLSVMLLGAVEVDRNFNVNVVQGADGCILGGPGGHPDTAQGAKLSIVSTTLTGGGFAKLVPGVTCISTLGIDVDVVVTEVGFAVNPARGDLADRFSQDGLVTSSIEALIARAADQAERVPKLDHRSQSIFVEHRNGTILDQV